MRHVCYHSSNLQVHSCLLCLHLAVSRAFITAEIELHSYFSKNAQIIPMAAMSSVKHVSLYSYVSIIFSRFGKRYYWLYHWKRPILVVSLLQVYIQGENSTEVFWNSCFSLLGYKRWTRAKIVIAEAVSKKLKLTSVSKFNSKFIHRIRFLELYPWKWTKTGMTEKQCSLSNHRLHSEVLKLCHML